MGMHHSRKNETEKMQINMYIPLPRRDEHAVESGR